MITIRKLKVIELQKKIHHIVIEGHNENEVRALFEEIQNKYGLYDNCVLETNLSPEDTIIDRNRYEETGRLSIDKKLVKKYGEPE